MCSRASHCSRGPTPSGGRPPPLTMPTARAATASAGAAGGKRPGRWQRARRGPARRSWAVATTCGTSTDASGHRPGRVYQPACRRRPRSPNLAPVVNTASTLPAPQLGSRPALGTAGAGSGAFVALTKPRIIELLLVTTVPTMVVAAGGWPSAAPGAWPPSSVARCRPAAPTPPTCTSTATSTP